ncbi:MAG: AraC family transcriptional regulator [Bacteroidota bacterium]
MKVLPFTIPKSERDALILQEDRQMAFYGFLHQHTELQISYIKEGKGSLIVGNSINRYTQGDIVVLGSNLPHVFKSDTGEGEISHMISIFFTQDSFGKEFFLTEELKSLKTFFQNAENGFKVSGISEMLPTLFEDFLQAQKLDRFILFFQLLKALNQSQWKSLSSFNSGIPSEKITRKYSDNEGQRMDAVIRYTMDHFREKISLDTIARQAAMTPNAFCKYFKKRTRKTYMSFLNEIRVAEACKLLQHSREMSIAEIAERSGFRNISNFNRKFKGLKDKSPRNFKKSLSL